MSVDWKRVPAAVWRPRRQVLRPVRDIDPVRLADLLGIERQKAELVRNTERFLARRPANNALLWGARGTGKSSLIKALLNDYQTRDLRIIEVERDDLLDLPEIVDEVREQPYRFLVFCDDLSFDAGERGYRVLKSVLEGSIERPPENVRVYATSNRRHLLPERLGDNRDSRIVDGELHHSDAVEETISLSDRFGLWLSFYPIGQDDYLAIVDHYFCDYRGDRDELHRQAARFALARGSRSGRIARQFYNAFTEPSE